MPKPKFPPDDWVIHIPATLLYDKTIPDAAKVTWAQLRGLAWGATETPPFSAEEFEEKTGTKLKTLYGHLRVLRDHHASRWHRGNGATFIVSFDCQPPASDPSSEFLEIENSGNRDKPILLDQSVIEDHRSKEVLNSGKREFQKSGKPPPANDGLFEAVAIATKRAPPGHDWRKMPGVTRGILNKVSGQLRKVEATVDQVAGFPDWFEKKKQQDYRLRRPLEPWDLPKFWTEYLGAHDGIQQGSPGTSTETPATNSGVSARVAAIQRAAAERAAANVPPLRTDAGTDAV